MTKKPLILIGGGGHCRACIDVIEQEGRFAILGIVDLPEKVGQTVLGYPILAADADLQELVRQYPVFFITLGQIRSPEKRMRLYQFLRASDVTVPTIFSPLAYVSPHAQVGAGTIVMHQAVVNAGAVVGENCIMNTKALIEHDARIGDHCHVSTGAILNGGVTVGEGSFIGSGAVCRESITIKSYSFIKANSLVKA